MTTLSTPRAARAATAALLMGVAFGASPRADAAEGAARFIAEGVVHPQGRSADGRFSGGGEARFVPQAASADGRFALKATQSPEGGCAPVADPIFANGFES